MTDEDGRPIPGVHVEAVYQTYNAERLPRGGASIKLEGVTAPSGRYSLRVGDLPPGEYTAHAYWTVVNGGRPMNISLQPSNPVAFANNAATVRDFRLAWIETSPELPYGNGGIFVVENALMDYTDLAAAEVTLTEQVAKTSFVRRLRRAGEGLVVTGIPFGTYRAEIRLDGRPLRLRLWGAGGPTGSKTASCTISRWGLWEISSGFMRGPDRVAPIGTGLPSLHFMRMRRRYRLEGARLLPISGSARWRSRPPSVRTARASNLVQCHGPCRLSGARRSA